MRTLTATLLTVLSLFVASPALAASAEEPAGLIFDPADYSGQVVYLDFWASWCAPCKASFPWMDALQRRHRSDGLVVVAVNLDQDPKAARRFLEQTAPTFEVKFDPSGQLARRYELEGMPSSYVLDRSGAVRYAHTGFRESDKDELEVQIRQALEAVHVSELKT